MKMIDLKIPKKTKKEIQAEREQYEIGPDGGDKYPYGTRLNFNTDEVKKLGVDVSKIKAGEEVTGKFKGKVIGVRQSERESGDKEQSFEVQIMAIGIEDGMDKAWKEAFEGKDE
ncbi:MAG: hypothetical protein SVS15_05650 [Thermodesulfobacteriota bacterium]|nr:hypothetical protein [Thermodesulfobacteriota bacterium]